MGPGERALGKPRNERRADPVQEIGKKFCEI
jgi:hypothetical protein